MSSNIPTGAAVPTLKNRNLAGLRIDNVLPELTMRFVQPLPVRLQRPGDYFAWAHFVFPFRLEVFVRAKRFLVPLSLRLPADLREAIRQRADEARLDVSSWTRYTLADAVGLTIKPATASQLISQPLEGANETAGS